jgi:quinoprotein dehydrogenase-associated probable ABC transporter substrate-binding protein
MRISQLIVGLGLAAAVATALAEEKFKVCADPQNPPYSTQKTDGFENKIAELFAKKLGATLEYTWFSQRIGFIRNTLTASVNELEVDSKNFKCDVVMGVPDGYDLTLNTQPYYQSTYVLLIAKGRGYDDIKQADDLTKLPLVEQEKLKIAMFDRGPGTAWLQKHGLLGQGIPYQSMSGDGENNPAMQIDKDIKDKKIDMVILWGPMAAYVAAQNPKDSYLMIPMQSTPDLKFDFAMVMGVRKPDKDRKTQLDKLITENVAEIQAIIESYNIPLVPLTKK